MPGWIEEVFLVHRVIQGPVPTYKIHEWDGSPVRGTFCSADLQKVQLEDNALNDRKAKCSSSGKVGPTKTTAGFQGETLFSKKLKNPNTLTRERERERQNVLLRGVAQPCQPTRISEKSSPFVQDSFTSSAAFTQRQVGLTAISLLDARVNLYDLVRKGDHVLGIKWHQSVLHSTGVSQVTYGAAQTKIEDIKDMNWIVHGVSFMKAALVHVEQQRRA